MIEVHKDENGFYYTDGANGNYRKVWTQEALLALIEYVSKPLVDTCNRLIKASEFNPSYRHSTWGKFAGILQEIEAIRIILTRSNAVKVFGNKTTCSVCGKDITCVSGHWFHNQYDVSHIPKMPPVGSKKDEVDYYGQRPYEEVPE